MYSTHNTQWTKNWIFISFKNVILYVRADSSILLNQYIFDSRFYHHQKQKGSLFSSKWARRTSIAFSHLVLCVYCISHAVFIILLGMCKLAQACQYENVYWESLCSNIFFFTLTMLAVAMVWVIHQLFGRVNMGVSESTSDYKFKSHV